MFKTSKMTVEEIRAASYKYLARKMKVPQDFVDFELFRGPVAKRVRRQYSELTKDLEEMQKIDESATMRDVRKRKTVLIGFCVEKKKPSVIRPILVPELTENYCQCPMCGQGVMLLEANHLNNHGNRLPVHKNAKGIYCVSPKNFAVVDCPMPSINEPPPELPPETDFVFEE